jgi:hypothetical protein
VLVGIEFSSRDQSVDFTPYFAGLPPLVAGVIVCLVGIVALRLLQKQFGFCVKSSHTSWSAWVTAISLAIPFMVTVTLADLTLTFPENSNVRLPTSLFFYPVMGIAAQMMLHIVPFGLLLWAFTRLFSVWPIGRCVWLSIVLAAVPEAAFQITGSRAQGDGFEILNVFVAVQLFAFGMVELYLYRRYDFFCMYLFRLTYYAYWHVLWGSLRI